MPSEEERSRTREEWEAECGPHPLDAGQEFQAHLRWRHMVNSATEGALPISPELRELLEDEIKRRHPEIFSE